MIRLVSMFCAVAMWTSARAADFVPLAPKQIDYVVRDRNGDGHTAAQFGARLTVLHFWASWCVPCRVELPALAALQSDLGREGVRVVAVSVDRLGWDAIDRTTSKLGVRDLELYHDRDREAAVALGVAALPTTILVDAQGREVARMRGEGEWADPALRRELLGFASP
ncbi:MULTISPECIES: TlpA disulfide reductase family protein [Bradyrhizobium]|nr:MULTISPECIES: TlpA disulfide reductase family protein [Bradyrhizobium]